MTFGSVNGYNNARGGLPYLSSLVPVPNFLIPIDGYVRFTLGVHGSSINLSTVRITVESKIAYDGSTDTFGADFLTSSYTSESGDNGYRFNILKTSSYINQFVTVIVEAETVSGVSTVQSYQVVSSELVDYPPVPYGVELGGIPIERFSGEPETGLLSGAAGLVFASPALKFQSSGSQIDIDKVEIATQGGDEYYPIVGDNLRPFLWGPPPLVPPVPIPVFPPQFDVLNYMPVWNGSAFGFLKTTERSVLGVLYDTVSLQTTYVLY